MKNNKYEYVKVIQGFYSCYGWEDLTEETTTKEARQRLKEYNENERETPHRIINRRVLKCN